MKTIANFGEWVTGLWAPLTLVFSVIVWVVLTLTGPQTVTLDAKHWECVMAVPDGLSTRCTEYIYKGK